MSFSLKDLDVASVRNMDDAKKQARIMAKIADERMNKYMVSAPQLVQKVHSYGVPKEAIFGFGGTTLTVLMLLILLRFGAQIVSAFVTIVQPLWFSYRALETETKDDDTILLTYWMVHGLLYLAENSILLPVTHLLGGPYFLLKMGVLFWMLNFEGSMFVYSKFLAPYFRQHEQEVVEALGEAKTKALELVQNNNNNNNDSKSSDSVGAEKDL